MKKLIIVVCIFVTISACSNKEDPTVNVYGNKPSVSYLFSKHDRTSGEWTIIKTDKEQHSKIKIIAICQYFRLGEHNDYIKGKDACSHQVGDVVNIIFLPKNRKNFTAVNFSSTDLYMIEGSGDDAEHNGYAVKSAELIPYE